MLGMITETMEKATLEVFKLPYGFQLHKHYWYSQYGEIDYSDIRFSITQTDEESDFFVAVANCHSYEHAMVKFLTQIQAQYHNQFQGLDKWICKLLDIRTQ